MSRLVTVPVMQIGVVRVFVSQRRVPVQVSVWHFSRIAEVMNMLMVFIMYVLVFVLQRFVGVLVLMLLRQMEP